MASPPLVSVIIPTYNYAQFLPEAVHSVLRQRANNLDVEIIVVDDGSTDNTQDVARQMQRDIVYVRQENQGLAAARNTGLRAARGDYVAFLDADDLYIENTLPSQIRVFVEQPQLDMVICRCLDKHDGTVPPVMSLWPLFNSHWSVHACHGNLAPVHCYLTRMDMVRRVGMFDTNLRACEDQDFWLRCHGLGCRIGVNPQGVAIYRKHGVNMTGNRGSQLFHDALMHLKVHDMLSHISTWPQDKYTGWLAHAAGSLFAVGGTELAPAMRGKMQNIFTQAVYELAGYGKNHALGEGEQGAAPSSVDTAQWLRIRSYYAVLCLATAARLEDSLNPEAATAVTVLRRLFPRAAQIPKGSLKARADKELKHLCLPDPVFRVSKTSD